MANNVWLGTTSGDLSVSANWLTGSVPAAGDNIRFVAAYNNPVSAGLTALNTATLSGALAAVIFENGYSAAVGAAYGSDFQFTCSRFESYGTGPMWIDLQASAIAPTIHNSSSPINGLVGINLIGSAITKLNVLGGNVGVASQFGETATVNTIEIIGQDVSVYVGIGTTLTTLNCNGGSGHEIHCAVAIVNMNAGTLSTKEVGAISSALNMMGGTIYCESTGAIAGLYFLGPSGTADFTTSAALRTITAAFAGGTGWTLKYDPTFVTISSWTSSTVPISLSATGIYS